MVRETKRERMDRKAAEWAESLTEPPPATDADDLGDDLEADDPGAEAAPDAGAITIDVEAEASAERLDAALARRIPGLSRSRLKALIGEGRVTLGGATVTDASRKINAGARIVVDLPAPVAAAPQAEDIPLDVVFEDDEVVVLMKPAGLVVHPGAGNGSGTLVNALLHHCKGSLSGIGGVERPGIVHRLDKDTSGLMVVAKTDRAHKSLAAQFADHGRTGPLERAYHAIVWGVPKYAEGTITTQIGRDPKNRQAMAAVKTGGREAITHFKVLETFGAPRPGAKVREASAGPVASLVECVLETGRTHQIRVHMAEIGHPLLGDDLYGSGFRTKLEKLEKLSPEAADALRALGRQALHARLLAFAHPANKRKVMRFEEDWPEDLERLAEALRGLD
ncbi:MAG: RluA family pseudouridine synthase [Hyphomicrobiales bacterium]|nr:RluA family pseudouridine synthase [Hyphomicrobiales bacterium]